MKKVISISGFIVLALMVIMYAFSKDSNSQKAEIATNTQSADKI